MQFDFVNTALLIGNNFAAIEGLRRKGECTWKNWRRRNMA
jgi:hypothetical protein